MSFERCPAQAVRPDLAARLAAARKRDRKYRRRRLAAVAGLILLVLALLWACGGRQTAVKTPAALPPEPTAPYPDTAGFQPGNIMSDAVFFNSAALDVAGAQAFLEQAGAGCRPGPMPCLSQFTEDAPSFAATTYCQTFTGRAGMSAAEIIVEVGRACSINPQVLLVMLQKEQGLVAASSGRLTEVAYRSAMGFACPDGGACDPAFFGFTNQVYHAAAQFQRYRLNPRQYTFQAGRSQDVPYSVDGACGASPVLLQNQATAGLYNYTPYQPNAAALDFRTGGDDCSQYGNAAFYGYFRVWFGATQ